MSHPERTSELVECVGDGVSLELLALVARTTDDGVVVADAKGATLWINDAFTRLTGWALDDLQGVDPATKLCGPDTNPVMSEGRSRAIESGKAWHGEMLCYRHDGSTFWLESTLTPVTGDDGRVTHFVSISRDVTVKRASAQRLVELAAAVEASMDGVAVVDGGGRFRFVNDAFARLFAYDRGNELWGKPWRGFYDRAQAKRFDDEVLPVLRSGKRWQGGAQARRRDGSTYSQQLSICSLGGASVVLVVRDVTEEQAAEDLRHRLSLTDSLTGLNNRAGLVALGEQQLRVSRRASERCVVFYLDLDDFKSINDVHDHATGDAALKEFAGILRGTFRASDVMSRVGGDEFVALAVDCDDAGEETIRERLRRQLAALNERPGRDYILSTACGIARFIPGSPRTLDHLMREAEAIMVERKRDRRSEVRSPRSA